MNLSLETADGTMHLKTFVPSTMSSVSAAVRADQSRAWGSPRSFRGARTRRLNPPWNGLP